MFAVYIHAFRLPYTPNARLSLTVSRTEDGKNYKLECGER